MLDTYSKNIVYLSKAQYQELITNGSITVNNQTVTYNDNDIYVTPQDEPITDVRINGTSIGVNGIANIPVATASAFGAAKVSVNAGTQIIGDAIGIAGSTETDIKAGIAGYKPIVASRQHYSIFYGLAKAAGADMASIANTTVGTYPPEQRGAIQSMLGIPDLIAPDESSLTASQAYAVGDVFFAQGKLYKATAAIAQDGAIVLSGNGANAEETSVSDDVLIHSPTFGEPTVLVDTMTLQFTLDEDNSWYKSTDNPFAGVSISSYDSNNYKFTIEWDGVEYEEYYSSFGKYEKSIGGSVVYGVHAIGNSTIIGSKPAYASNAPFVICKNYYYNQNTNVITLDNAQSHTIKIIATPFVADKPLPHYYTDPNYIQRGTHSSSIMLGGNTSLASGAYSLAEGFGTTATGIGSHAEGSGTVASLIAAHAEGFLTAASGNYSHAEGSQTKAEGNNSHAEGMTSRAKGVYSHAEGADTEASGGASHAEGYGTIAKGNRSHAEGMRTIANGLAQHADGNYNVADSYSSWPEWVADTSYVIGDKVKVTSTVDGATTVTGYICKTANTDSSFVSSNWSTDLRMNYAVITGNGTATNARSNAYALTWEGDGKYAGDVYVGCNTDSSGGTKLAKITDVPTMASIIAAVHDSYPAAEGAEF